MGWKFCQLNALCLETARFCAATTAFCWPSFHLATSAGDNPLSFTTGVLSGDPGDPKPYLQDGRIVGCASNNTVFFFCQLHSPAHILKYANTFWEGGYWLHVSDASSGGDTNCFVHVVVCKRAHSAEKTGRCEHLHVVCKPTIHMLVPNALWSTDIVVPYVT
jgi:hypothetical protein